MKLLKIIFIVCLVCSVVFFVGGIVFLKNFNINQHIPQVVEAVAKSTGRQLTVGRAGLAFSLSKGLMLTLQDASLTDDKKFSDQLFLKIPQAWLTVDVGAIIHQRKIVISDMTFIAPEIRIIRAKDGRINAASMNPLSVSSAAPVVQAAAPGQLAAFPVLLVKRIDIKGAIVHYTDHLFDPAISLNIDKIDMKVMNFSLTDPFQVSLNAALFSETQNVMVSGKMGLDLIKLAGRLESLQVEVSVAQISAFKLNAALPMIAPLGFKQANGVLRGQFKEARIGAKGLEHLDAQGVLKLSDVILEGGNILAAGLNSISMFPGLMEAVLAQFPAKTQENIKRGITFVDGVEIILKADQQKIALEKAELFTHEVMASANGTVSLAGELNLSSAVFISSDVSKIIVEKISDIGSLKKEDGRIYIPFFISGMMLSPKVKPDMDYLTKHLLVHRGKQELQKVLKDPAVSDAVGDLFNTIFKSK